jgi:hypothetical protein
MNVPPFVPFLFGGLFWFAQGYRTTLLKPDSTEAVREELGWPPHESLEDQDHVNRFGSSYCSVKQHLYQEVLIRFQRDRNRQTVHRNVLAATTGTGNDSGSICSRRCRYNGIDFGNADKRQIENVLVYNPEVKIPARPDLVSIRSIGCFPFTLMGKSDGNTHEFEEFGRYNVRLVDVGIPVGFRERTGSTSTDKGCTLTLGNREEAKGRGAGCRIVYSVI